jgi:class 3 adenylate cyclase
VSHQGPSQERKVVTALFCDLVGSTAAAESADPEDVQRRLARFHHQVRGVIEAHAGRVEKYAGDAILATFGAPLAHEDDAERAVRAALAVLDALAGLNREDPSPDLHVRIGINTGEAVVDLSASGDTGMTLVFGDVVNTAARVEAAAAPDTVLITDSTRRATQGTFEIEQASPVHGKGKAEPIGVWTVLRPRARLGVDVLRSFDTPLVGREREQAALVECLAQSRRTGGGVLVVGEPGVGKSRLVAHLLAHVTERPDLVTWRQGRCLPYGSGITYWALADIVKAHAGIEEGDSATVAAAKLEATLPGGVDDEVLRTRLLPLLGVDTGVVAARDDSFRAWTDYLRHMAGESQAVLVFEDVHWADDSMLAFLDHLDNHLRDAPILVVCTARPELQDSSRRWVSFRYGTLRLSALAEDAISSLIDDLTADMEVPPALRTRLLEQCGGNPLYAEELVRALRDIDPQRYRDEAPPLPDTLHGVITARLDALPRAAKTTIQTASVIGKTFSAEAVRGISGADEEALSSVLADLAHREFLREIPRSLGTRSVDYSFWHVLVRDAAYGSLSRADRLAAHTAYIEWLSSVTGDRLDDVAEILAEHCESALSLATALHDSARGEQLTEDARSYALLAGRRAHGLDAHAAVRWLEKAYARTPPEHPDALETMCLYGGALFDLGLFDECIEVLAPVWDAAVHSPHVMGGELIFQGCIDYRNALGFMAGEADFSEFDSMIDTAIDILDDSPGLAFMLGGRASSLLIDGSPPDTRLVVEIADRAMDMAERTSGGNALAPCTRGVALALSGDAHAYSHLDEVMETQRQKARPTYALFSYGWQSIADFLWKGPATALERADAAFAFADARGMEVAKLLWVGNRATLAALAGDISRAAADQAWVSEHAVHIATFAAEILRVRLESHRPVDGIDRLIEEVLSTGSGSASVDAAMRVTLAHQRLSLDDESAALALAVEIDPHLGANPWFIEWVLPLSRLYLRLGLAEPLRLLRDAVPTVTPGWLLTHRTVAIHLAHATGDHAHCRDDAARIVDDWSAFDCPLEAAYAQRHLAECLANVHDSAADEARVLAQGMFTAMGATHLGRC